MGPVRSWPFDDLQSLESWFVPQQSENAPFVPDLATPRYSITEHGMVAS